MNWRALAAVIVAVVALTGCDKIPFIGGKDQPEQPAAADTTTAPDSGSAPEQAPAPAAPESPGATSVETPSARPAATPRAPEPPPRQQVNQIQRSGQAVTEIPWVPTATGTVDPGMTPEEVVGVWGPPVTQRSAGNWLFLFYRNGCERRCGKYDVVFFEGGQVVDAVVRGPGHAYSGISSSPPERAASFTAPGSDPIGVGG